MVFRKESKVDAFQRQISALRQQLGADAEHDEREQPGPYGDESRATRPSADRFPEQRPPSYGTPEPAGYTFAGAGSTADDPFGIATMPAPPAIATPEVDAQTSVVAHDTKWNGDLQVGGSLHVHGRMEGSITAEQDVYVAEEADVTATISAANVIIAGRVKGTIRCRGRFEVLPQGRVSGDFQAPTLVIHEGASVNGQFRMGSGEAATQEQPTPTVVHRRAARGGA